MHLADTSHPPPPWDGQDTLHALGLAAVALALVTNGCVPVLLTGVLILLGAALALATWDPKRHGGED